MQIIHCTKKLLHELKVLGSGMPSGQAPGFLGPWHANQIRIERKKCILFTNDRTLYSFLVAGVKKKDLDEFHDLFLLHLSSTLVKEDFGRGEILKALEEYREIEIAPTISRRVLGSMNDLAAQAKFLILSAGGLKKVDLLTVNMLLNRIPMGSIKYCYAIEKIYELFGRTDKIHMSINPFTKTSV